MGDSTGTSRATASTMRTWSVVLMAGLVLAPGCARSPEAKKARYMERGDAYFEREQYREAVIEYGNALRVDGTDPRAVRQLARAHFELGELGLAFPYLVRSKELEPDDADTRLKLGSLYLLARKNEEARAEAAAVLEKDPKNFNALLLSVGAATKPDELAGVIRTMEARRSEFDGRAKFHMALGTLYAKTGDFARTEREFKDAVAKEPTVVDAHTVLGNFYVGRGDTHQAEREYRVAAELTPMGSPERLNLADFYLSFEKPDEGKRILEEMTQKAPDFLAAWRRLAEVALREGKIAESLKALEPVFKKSPADFEGQLLQARARLAKGQTSEAVEQLQRLVKVDTRSAQAHYQLAVAYLRTNNVQQARVELKDAATLQPDFADAILLQAEVNLRAGSPQPAIEAVETLVATRPAEARGWMLLGDAYMAKRDAVKAADMYARFMTLAPKDPRGPYLLGVALIAQRKNAEAKRQFEATLALSPGHLESLGRLVAMAFAEKTPDVALERVKREIGRAPESAGLHHLLGTVYLQRNERAPAEAAFVKALRIDARHLPSYVALAEIYSASGNNERALEQATAAVKAAPTSTTAHMLAGAIHERRGDFPKAIAEYERTLALDPGLASAANNLAYLYAEHGGDKEKALEYARRAKEKFPDEPAISDTLGWVLYRRGVYQQAVSYLKDSAAELPDVPEVHFHLGMAHYKLGERAAAKQELNRALTLSPRFSAAGEARRVLAELEEGRARESARQESVMRTGP